MRPEKIHFPLPTPDQVQEGDAFFLLPSIHALFESVYGKKKKKALPLLHCARSGKREMYFFWAHCPFSPHGGTSLLEFLVYCGVFKDAIQMQRDRS